MKGDFRRIKRKIDINLCADSLLPQSDTVYRNGSILKNKEGKSVTFSSKNPKQIPDLILWDNGWHTIVSFKSDNEIMYYTFDKKNRLRKFNSYLISCHCFKNKIEFNRKGNVVYIYNEDAGF
jgi:hypothetical protein